MLEDSVSSTWESMANWFTPTVLFLLLNLMIATIAFTSSLTKQNSSPTTTAAAAADRSRRVTAVHRPKSATLQPFDSDPFYNSIESHTHYLFQHATPTPIQSDPQIQPDPTLETQPPIEAESDGGAGDFDLASAVDEDSSSLNKVYSQVMGNKADGVGSEEQPQAEVVKVKMKRSSSLGSDFLHSRRAEEEEEEKESIEARRPATVRERVTSKGVGGDGDEEVDARADDFINKFKHQLKLQRMESILRAGGANM